MTDNTRQPHRTVAFLRCLAATMLALLACAPSQGSPELPSVIGGEWFGDPASDPLVANIALGHAGYMITDRWTPARITIASGDGGGYEGVIRLTIRDRGDSSTHQAPFVLPPMLGATNREGTTVWLGFIAPSEDFSTPRWEIEIVGRAIRSSERPSVLLRASIDSSAAHRTTGQTPRAVRRLAPMVLSVGTSSVGIAAASPSNNPAWSHGMPTRHTSGPRGVEHREPPVAISGSVDGLVFPVSRWMLYDGLDSIVLPNEPLKLLTEEQREALRRWVDSGGHLVLIDNLMGTDARTLIPDGMLRVAVRPRGDDDEGRIALLPTPHAMLLGWQTLDVPELPRGSAAGGPVGLGRVSVVVADPRSLLQRQPAAPAAAEPQEEAGDDADAGSIIEINRRIAQAWRVLLATDTPHEVLQAMNSHDQQAHSRYIFGQSQLHRAMDSGARLMNVRETPVVLVGAMVVGLGLLIALGTTVGDWFLLATPRRRRLSFITALCWLVVGSGIALVVPLLIRAGDTTTARVQVIDINAATGISASAELFTISVGCRTDFLPPSQSPESWTREVIAAEARRRRLFAPVQTQHAGNQLPTTQAALWTFHATLTEAPGAPDAPYLSTMPPAPRLLIDPSDDAIVLELPELIPPIDHESLHLMFSAADRATASVPGSHANAPEWIATQRRLWPLHAADARTRRIRLTADAISRPRAPLRTPALGLSHMLVSDTQNDTTQDGFDVTTDLLGIPGVGTRTARMLSAIDSTRFAVLVFRLKDPVDATMPEPRPRRDTAPPDQNDRINKTITHRWVRIMIPIDDPTHERLLLIERASAAPSQRDTP